MSLYNHVRQMNLRHELLAKLSTLGPSLTG